MYRRLPSCKVSGLVLLALCIFVLGVANAPRAEADTTFHPGVRVTTPEYLTVIDAGSHPATDYTNGLTIVVKARALRSGGLRFKTSDGVVWFAPACQVEDSVNCWWDARTRGNHRGTPVVNLFGSHLRVMRSIL